MAGIYIHIPFCKQKCHYCNFFSRVSLETKAGFLEALFDEILRQKDYLGGHPVSTIYFGGGTPSLLSEMELGKILDTLNRYYPVTPDAEITLEANPDDLNPGLLRAYKNCGVNRFSLGIQSFSDADLSFLGRRHDTSSAIQAIRDILEAGFAYLSIDLIYGIPGMSWQHWEKNLEVFFSFELKHLSAYALTVEPKTTLDLMIRNKKMPAPDEEDTIQHFQLLMKKMAEKGFEHYEISNFTKEGQYSRHNSNYWKGIPYLGLGPSAHSYNGRSRQWNVSSLKEYIRNLSDGMWYEEETLTPVQKYNEYIMTSLRTMWGCDSKKIISDFPELTDRKGLTLTDFFRKQARLLIEKELLFESDGIYYLTETGKFFADGVAADLFFTESR